MFPSCHHATCSTQQDRQLAPESVTESTREGLGKLGVDSVDLIRPEWESTLKAHGFSRGLAYCGSHPDFRLR